MSRSAVSFLLLALCSWVGVMMLPLQSGQLEAGLKITAAVSLLLFVLALVRGRRIKFDPLLR